MLLVIAATSAELAPDLEVVEGARTLTSGIGPIEAAVACARGLASADGASRPTAVLNVGIAGCRRGCGLAPGAVVLGSEAVYDDLSPAHLASTRVMADAGMLERARSALVEAYVRPIGTSAAVAGSRGSEVEAMEGFAVLRAAERAGLPALELRVISNEIEQEDRGLWEIDLALGVLHAATARVVTALT